MVLVPVKGGRWHIIPQLAVYTTSTPLTYSNHPTMKTNPIRSISDNMNTRKCSIFPCHSSVFQPNNQQPDSGKNWHLQTRRNLDSLPVSKVVSPVAQLFFSGEDLEMKWTWKWCVYTWPLLNYRNTTNGQTKPMPMNTVSYTNFIRWKRHLQKISGSEHRFSLTGLHAKPGIFEFNSSGWSLKKGRLVDRVNIHFNKLLKNQNSLAECGPVQSNFFKQTWHKVL